MAYTHFSKFSADALSFVTVEDKTSKAGPYKVAKFCYDHEDNDGNVMTGDLSFEMPEIKIPYGLTLENGYNLKGRFDFARDSEQSSQCVSSILRSQTKGWISKEDVDIEMDVGSCTAIGKKGSVKVYTKPDTSASLVDTTSETMNVVGKSPDKKFLSVVYGGSDGFFEQLRQGFSKIVFQNKDKLDMGDKTEEEILKLISDPVYISKDKKTGKILDKDPSVYFNVIYYSAKPANGDYPAMRERVANFEIPGMDECLDLNALMSKCVTCIPTVKIMHLTKSGSKLSMKIYVTAAIVTDIEDIVKKENKSDAYNKFSQNSALVEKMRKKMEKIKQESPTPKEEAPVNERNEDPYVQTTPEPESDDFNLEDMLNSSSKPVMEDIDLDNN
jgi:hypothetical protein